MYLDEDAYSSATHLSVYQHKLQVGPVRLENACYDRTDIWFANMASKSQVFALLPSRGILWLQMQQKRIREMEHEIAALQAEVGAG